MLRLFLILCLCFGLLPLDAEARKKKKRRKSLRRAYIHVSGDSLFDFGQKFLGRHYDRTILIRNIGTKMASKLEATIPHIEKPFTYKGGKWPGIGGTCKGKLRAGQSCKIVVRFEPSQLGTFQTYLRLKYHDGRRISTTTKIIGGSAVEEGCTEFDAEVRALQVGLGGKLRRNFGPGDYRCAVRMEDGFRSFNLHVPSSYRKKSSLPLVLVFHGGAETAIGIETQSDFSRKADQEGFIVAYPIASSQSRSFASQKAKWNSRAWKRNSATNDIEFVQEMLNYLEDKFKVDSDRIYATGISNGAIMTYRLACTMPKRFAAFAPIGGGNTDVECQPETPVSLLHIHGTSDPGWPFDGGPSCFTGQKVPSVMASLILFQQLNGCSGKAAKPTKLLSRGDVTCYTRRPCKDSTEVALCTVNNGGLTWPGGSVLALSKEIPWGYRCGVQGPGKGVGPITRDFSATRVIWDFFARHSR